MQKERVLEHGFVRGVLILLSGVGLFFALTAYSDPDRIAPAACDHEMLAANASAPESLQSAKEFLIDTAQNNAREEAIIVDHTCTDITEVPQEWIEEAKRELHIGYGHTSHGGQLTGGMAGLIDFANGGGLGLSLPENIFQFSPSGNDGGDYLHLFEGSGWDPGDLSGDCGYYAGWVNETRAYLGTPDPVTGRGTNHPEMNVIIWSWCGQVSERTEQTMLDTYLLPMTQLEEDYPGVTFVYMTGHPDGTGEEGNLHLRNQQIKDYCIENDRVLYDFYDIELYDPDGNYYGDKGAADGCGYDRDGDGSTDWWWCITWQNAHTEGVDWYSCDCPHSYPIICNQKAYAAWWLWARLAGWDGGIQPEPQLEAQKTASAETVVHGQTFSYTVSVRNTGAPLTATVHLTDEVPTGLTYVPGTLSATTGTATDVDAPALRWSGDLSSTPVVTVTYAVVVDAPGFWVITNSAMVTSPGCEAITVTETITAEAPSPPDLTPSYKIAYPTRGDVDDPITYTVSIRNAAGPLSDTVWLTDTVPDGLVYVPGTLTSTAGVVSEAAVPALYWSGALSPAPVVTVTYAATVDTAETEFIINHAIIALPGHQPITRIATILVNPPRLYLPLILRDS